MQAPEAEFGPIDVVVIGAAAGAPLTGEALPILLKLDRRLATRTSDSRDTYWVYPFENYQTSCPYLVGSYQSVADELAHHGERVGRVRLRSRRTPPVVSAQARCLNEPSRRASGSQRDSNPESSHALASTRNR